jgi:nucleoid-associated protein YgaU
LLCQISKPLARRWHSLGKSLPDGRRYHPAALSNAAAVLDAYPLEQISAGGAPVLAEYIVRAGDTLSDLAVRYYGKGEGRRWKDIFHENRDVLDEEDDLFAGQVLRIPDIRSTLAREA